MKTFIKLTILFCFMILLTMDACTFLTGDECDDTTIDFDEPIIYLRLHITDVYPPDNTHLPPEADTVKFDGSIQKVYCGGDYSDGFTFTHILFLAKDYTKEYLSEGVFLSQPYQFKFTNSEDRLSVITSFEFYFKDGKVFECVGNASYRHKDIKYDFFRMDKYIDINLPEPRGWREVHPK